MHMHIYAGGSAGGGRGGLAIAGGAARRLGQAGHRLLRRGAAAPVHAPAPSLAALMAPSRAIPSPAPSPLNTPSPTSVPSPAPTLVPSPAPHELRMPASTTTTTEARTPCGSFEALSRRDFPRCELLVVLGTSLAVQPFAGNERSSFSQHPDDAPSHVRCTCTLIVVAVVVCRPGRQGGSTHPAAPGQPRAGGRARHRRRPRPRQTVRLREGARPLERRALPGRLRRGGARAGRGARVAARAGTLVLGRGWD